MEHPPGDLESGTKNRCISHVLRLVEKDHGVTVLGVLACRGWEGRAEVEREPSALQRGVVVGREGKRITHICPLSVSQRPIKGMGGFSSCYHRRGPF